MKKIELAVLTVCLAVALVLTYSGRKASANPALDVADLQQVRGMGNAFTLYVKKYNYFPAMTDVSKVKEIGDARAKGNCVCLKLLLAAGYVEDATIFFSPRMAKPDADTMALMTKEMDPAKDKAWACTYAYDAGHKPGQNNTILYGTVKDYFNTHKEDAANVLNCNMTAKELDHGDDGKYVLKAHAEGKTATINDDIYVDDSKELGFNDTFLQYDVGPTLAKPAAKPEEKK